MAPIGNQTRLVNDMASKQIRLLTDERLDFARTVPLRKSYVVACSDRSSSLFLCRSLWQAGRFGAPWDYLNASFEDLRGTLAMPVDRSFASTMMKRLCALSPIDYIAKLLGCRTSNNGVFGLKARFDDFERAIEEVPELLKMLAPVTYIYVDCRDKLSQAVAVTRALLASRSAAASPGTPESLTLRYDRDLISKCLGRLERQRLDWWRWFQTNGIDPFVVYYEDANGDIAGVVRSIAELLDVQSDVAVNVRLPPVKAERGALTDEWAARFTREIERGIDVREPDADVGRTDAIIADFAPASKARDDAEVSNIFRTEVQRHEYQQFHPAGKAGEDFEASAGSNAPLQPLLRPRPYQAVADFLRQWPRYEQIIGRNRELLQNAYVLDLMSGDGRCSLAALDAGAAYVVGVDPRPARVAAAERALAGYDVPRDSYRFVNMDITAALNDTDSGTFDVIVARGILERSPREPILCTTEEFATAACDSRHQDHPRKRTACSLRLARSAGRSSGGIERPVHHCGHTQS